MIKQQLDFVTAWITARFNVDSERGATAVEYGIMVAAIAAIIVATVFTLGTKVHKAFTDTNTKMP